MTLRSSHWRHFAKIIEYVFFKTANLQSIKLHLCSKSMKNTCEGVQLCKFADLKPWWIIELLRRYFLIGFSTVAESIFCRTPPSGCLCVLLERNEIVCFYCIQSDILLCGIARFSRGNKNKLRTFQPQKWKKKIRTASLNTAFPQTPLVTFP